MKAKDIFTSRAQMQRLVRAGREAIEKRMLRAIVLPIDRQNSEAEVEEITALLHKYNEVMAVYEKPKATSTPTQKPSSDENSRKT
jgi:16S rRNA U516 pseudouridylate synthase RsuA-like enzyme